jgi:hypothetical protein
MNSMAEELERKAMKMDIIEIVRFHVYDEGQNRRVSKE